MPMPDAVGAVRWVRKGGHIDPYNTDLVSGECPAWEVILEHSGPPKKELAFAVGWRYSAGKLSRG